MRCLVTGAAGYVGAAVVHELVARGHEVVAVVRHGRAGLPAAVQVRNGDLLDEAFAREAVRDVDGVCHLAALTRVREAASDPARYYQTNVGCTADLLHAMTAASGRRPGRFVFASTASVYGTPE